MIKSERSVERGPEKSIDTERSDATEKAIHETYMLLLKTGSLEIFLKVYTLLYLISFVLIDIPVLSYGSSDYLPKFLVNISEELRCVLAQDPLSCHPKLWYKGLILLANIIHFVCLFQLQKLFALREESLAPSGSDEEIVKMLGYLFALSLSSVYFLLPCILELVFNPVVESFVRPMLVLYIPFLGTTTYLSYWTFYLYTYWNALYQD